MERKSAFLLGLFFVINTLHAQIINKVPLSERITGYKMDVKT